MLRSARRRPSGDPPNRGRPERRVAQRRPHLQRQLDVGHRDRRVERLVEVGDGPRHPSDTVIAATGQPVALDLVAQQRAGGVAERGERVELVGRERGVELPGPGERGISCSRSPAGAPPPTARSVRRRAARRRQVAARPHAGRSDRSRARQATQVPRRASCRRTRTRREGHRHTGTGWWRRRAGTWPASRRGWPPGRRG